MSRSNPLRIGHRGAAGFEPENTLRSFARAIALGVDLIELDVQRTRDGELIVLHDKRVDRTTDGTGYASSMSLTEIKRLSVPGGETIPTLREVLDLAGSRVGLMLEIITPDIAQQVVRAVRSHDPVQDVIYASFLHEELLRVRELRPDASTLALLEGIPVQPLQFARDARATHVGLSIDSLTEPFVQELQGHGVLVFAYTANDPRDIEWLRGLRVDGIISDYPDRIASSLAER